MIKIRTFIGPKKKGITGLLRRQIELDRHLKNREDVKLTYEYYEKPKNPIDYFSKRYILYPYYAKKTDQDPNTVNHIIYQFLGDLTLHLDETKTIITCHDIFTFIGKNIIKKPLILKKYSLLGLRRCRYIISVSEFTKNELIEKYRFPKDKIVVIKNAINREIFKPLVTRELNKAKPIFPNYKKLLHVGNEDKRKDVITLLKAFYIVKKKVPKIKLLRVGQPAYLDFIKNLGLTNDVIYLEDINNKRLREIYNLSDFLVFPSLYEGFGFPGLEAASCGTPVICSDIPVFREVYEDFPLYFPPQDYKTLGNLIITNINNEDLKRKMSNNGLKIAKKYSWRKSSEKYLHLIKNIIEN